jgi:hypothetical protein
MSKRAQDLAKRLQQGADALIATVEPLSDAEWQTPCPGDGRTVGVVAHHVASAYLVELDFVRQLASGQTISGVTPETIDEGNAQHAREHADPDKAGTLELLRRNSALAAEVIGALSDEELDRVTPISLYRYTPLSTQYYIEDHPVRHSYHHLTTIQSAFDSACTLD